MNSQSRYAWAILVLICAVLITAGCNGASARKEDSSTPVPTQTTAVTETGSRSTGSAISALGTVRPAQTLQLSFGASGAVRAVPARVGTQVQAGDLLAELDTTALEIALQSARQEVAARKAALDGLVNGPDTELAERAEVEHTQQIAEAEIARQVAGWQLEGARLQAQAADRDHVLSVAVAQATREQLDLQLARASAYPPTTELVVAQVNLTRAQDARDAARIEYQKALDRPWEPQEIRDALAKAIWHAELDLTMAQARLEGAQRALRAHALGVSALAVQRVVARIKVTQTLDSAVDYTITLALLEAEVNLAQLRLDGLRVWENPYLDPPSPDQVAQAEAALRQAELAVNALEWQLRGAEIRAPFDGIISAVHLWPGEWGAPGLQALEVLDTTRWHVETRNVSELEIARVQVGLEAAVRVIAFRDRELGGRVIAISPVAVVQQGDTTYTLVIELDQADLNLRPGMNAEVTISTE